LLDDASFFLASSPRNLTAWRAYRMGTGVCLSCVLPIGTRCVDGGTYLPVAPVAVHPPSRNN